MTHMFTTYLNGHLHFQFGISSRIHCAMHDLSLDVCLYAVQQIVQRKVNKFVNCHLACGQMQVIS